MENERHSKKELALSSRAFPEAAAYPLTKAFQCN